MLVLNVATFAAPVERHEGDMFAMARANATQSAATPADRRGMIALCLVGWPSAASR
jgi:hypothetical protein